MTPPNETKKKAFSKALRGYDTAEVDEYIGQLLQTNRNMQHRMHELEAAYSDLYRKYKALSVNKEAVKNDLIDAKKASEKIVAEANEKAEIIVRASKANCDYIINDFRRTVSEERTRLLQIQSDIQRFKDTLLNECRSYIDRLEELAQISDTTLYYSTDEELVARAIDEVKTDIRYALAEKEQLDTISDSEVKVDLECFEEASKEEDAANTAAATGEENAASSELEKTNIVPDSSMEKTKMIPESSVSEIGDKYMEFLDELAKKENDT